MYIHAYMCVPMCGRMCTFVLTGLRVRGHCLGPAYLLFDTATVIGLVFATLIRRAGQQASQDPLTPPPISQSTLFKIFSFIFFSSSTAETVITGEELTMGTQLDGGP